MTIITLPRGRYTITDRPSFWASFIVWLLFVPHIRTFDLCTIRIAAVALAVTLAVVFSDLGQVLGRVGFTFLQFILDPIMRGVVLC